VYQARKWGWKQYAANLLLAPVIGIGGWTGVAHGQFGPSTKSPLTGGAPAAGMSSAAKKDAARPAKTGGDYQNMLKEGRKALAAGQFDRAQDLARAAEANNPTGKWGLFEDTPNSLLKDVQAAVVKAQKAQSETMADEAKKLLAQPTKTETERAANLDRALQLAQRADQLHGPYSAWEFGDRPDKLVKDITAARGKLKAPALPGGTGTAVASKGPNTAPVMPASGTKPANGSNVTPAGGVASRTPAMPATSSTAEAKKTAATKLMAEGRKLADQGQFGAARAKYAEADKLGATFGRGEPTPGFALQELNTRAAKSIDSLVTEAKVQMGKGDFAKADAALTGAGDVAATLGMFPNGVKEAKAQLWTASAGKFGTATPGLMAAGGPETLVPVAPTGPAAPVAPLAPTAPVASGTPMAPVAPLTPVAPVASASTPGTATVGNPAPAGTAISGRTLLLQAETEYKAGDLDLAAKLALQAYNLGGVKDEASALLNSIDAERLTQKTLGAVRSFEAAQASMKNKDYSHAMGVLVLIDPNLLPAASKTKHAELLAECRAATEKPAAGVATAGGTQEPVAPGMSEVPPVSALPPGTSQVTGEKPGGADNYANQVESLKRVQVQKLRADGLKVQSDALAAFGRGETDLAMQMLTDYANRVRASGLEASSVAMLLRPIDSRLDMFKVMKGQTDAITRVNKESRDAKAIITERGLAEDQRRSEVAASFKKYHELVKVGKYAEAEKVAMQAKALDPDNPAVGALVTMAKTQKRVQEQEQLKSDKERMVYGGLTDAEKPGAFVSVENPISIQLESYRRSRGRGTLDNAHIRTRSPAEYDIELKLDKPIPIEINQTPLDRAIDHLRDVTGLPISIDTNAIAAEGINLSTPITEKLTPVATRHILTIVLEKAGLSYVVENDVVKVTTTKKAKGRLFTKVFSVADLVTPVPNFALPDYANFDKMLKQNALTSGNVQIGQNGGTPQNPQGGLGGGTWAGNGSLPGASAATPGIGGSPFGGAGQLQSSGGGANPLAGSASLASDRNTKHEQLIKLITGMVRPYSWDGMGGPGRIEYFDIGSALVVNQVADVIQEVADLLEALRRLQDLAIAVEIRIVSLSETWYERLGVDFSMNIKTHNSSFEPALTQVDPNTGSTGVFRPSPYINDNNFKGATIGLTPAGSFTGDLDVPIRPNTFNRAIPPFGGYPNTPGDNGGLAFGLAFLNDIQVYMFMEAAQGDRRVNVMQAPKLTLFNGQTATLAVTNTSFFVTNVSVISVNGQLVFSPTNTPLAGPDTNFNIGIQAVVSADRRFVRLNLPVNLAAQTGATVPLFPITTFITPVFEGGSQGIPIPFTQFLQQPSFTSLNIQTTVVCPDGGTVLLGGLKTLQEGRNEFGPPVLSKIPYLNRLFKNVGIGRETTHIMIMVTPRIIINSEEEIFQTEGRPPVGQ
jgi:type II secretory pathway component GspD/PulD (secretin)/tetratricopeptide (TPR) repeat protein